MYELVLGAILCASEAGPYSDTDRDGLLDRWETVGFGPIDPRVHGCKPSRSDVFIVFRIRSNMTQEKIQPTIDRMKRFYASLPTKNADGSTGINMIAVVPPPMPKETDSKGYIELYEQAMPREWRGLAHGIMVDDSPGGGGQCNRPDWCGAGYNWHTMLHEVGHQFGLPHDPMGATTGSPFHRSMMNYDYSYQLGGNGEAIVFSDGKFAAMRMKETNLRETVPFSVSDLDFLSKQPYYFKLKEMGAGKTAVDWNRNGVFGESGVRADVNDGYAVTLRSATRLERTAGQAAMVGLQDRLLVIYPDLLKPEAYKDFAGTSLSASIPGRLQAQLVKNGKPGTPVQLVPDGVTGNPSAVWHRGEVWCAYPTARGFVVGKVRIPRAAEHMSFAPEKGIWTPGGQLEPTLVSTPTGLVAVLWNPADHSVKVLSMSGSDPEAHVLAQITSQHPVGAVWNSKRQCIGLVTTEKQNNFDGRMRITHLRCEGSNWKVDGDPIWVGGEKGEARGSSQPIPVFQTGRDAGPNGQYTVYVKGQYPDPAQPGVNYSCRQVADPTHGGGWRIKMMGNEWALSRTVCSVASFQGDIAYIYRWSWGDDSHRMLLTLKASGIEDEWLTDFDEVSFIVHSGLQQSLRAVQREQWRKSK